MRNGSNLNVYISKRLLAGRQTEFGFAYVALLVMVAVLGLLASSSLRIGAQMSRREAEQSLLAVGGEFERALYSYVGATVNNNVAGVSTAAIGARGPRTLAELLKDPRTIGVRRHLRQIYADPMTGQMEWGFVKDPAGYILGIYSKSSEHPIKQTGFEPTQAHFEDAVDYSQWIFGLPNALQASKANASAKP